MLQKFSAFLLYRIFGWTLVGELPRQHTKILVLFLPHTSNWDFVIGWLFIQAEGLRVTLFGKDGFYFFPLKYAYSWFGVKPIKRGQKANFVNEAVAMYQENDYLWTAMAPEGTRSHMDELKSGYYYLAKTAEVPMVLAGPNFLSKTIYLKPPREPMETFEQDATDLLDFCESMHGKRPALGIR